MRDKITGCLVLFVFAALGIYFILAEFARAWTWIKWAFN